MDVVLPYAINGLLDLFKFFLRLNAGKLHQLQLNVNVNVPFTIDKEIRSLFAFQGGRIFYLIAIFASRFTF